MTPAELDRFIKRQLNMGARIAQKANRARIGAAAFTNVKSSSGPSLGDRIIAALDRPGVAPSSRPLSKEGAQTFHFALTTVSRTSEYAAKMKNDVAGKAGDHMGYVEREGAAEKLDPKIKREADAIDREAWAILGGQQYIERPDAAEVMPDGRTHASFGNIAATLAERIDFWRALEEAAPKPKTHGIVTDRTTDKAFWEQVDRDTLAPATLRATPQWIALPVDQAKPDAGRLNKPIPAPRVTDKEALAVAQYAAKHRSRGKGQRPAVTVDPGRGGRIQNRIIVELPHELSAADRLKVAENFCSKMFVEGRTKPLPHWCVIHKPDHHNDARNTHMHILFAERPADRVTHPQTGKEVWDFEVVEEKKDKHRNKWTTRPLEQKPDRSLQERSWVKNARNSYAEIANAVLKAAGKSKIYDARSYKAMGIDVTPNKHINRNDYTSEKKGLSTKAGNGVIALQWANEEARLSARHGSFEPEPRVLNAFNREIKRWARSSTRYKLMSLRHEWTIAQAHRKYYTAEAAANALIMRKIKSKLAPPLGTDAKMTKDVTDYLRMFKTDLIDRHKETAARWKQNEKYVITSLRQLQRADPKIATMSTFLDGSSVMQAMNGMMTQARIIATSRPPMDTATLAKTIMDETREVVEEQRTIRDSLKAVEKAREGTIEQYPAKIWEIVPAKPAQELTTALQPKPVQLDVPHPDSVPRWDADGRGRFALASPTVETEITPTVPPRKGDEIFATFLSDTGPPVQQRVFSPSRIRETEEKAAAIIAAMAKRKADREHNFRAAQAAEEKFARMKAFLAGTGERRAEMQPNERNAKTEASAPAEEAATPTPATTREVKEVPRVAPAGWPTAAPNGTEIAQATPVAAASDARPRVAMSAPERSLQARGTGASYGRPEATVDTPKPEVKPADARSDVPPSPKAVTGVTIDIADIEVEDAPPEKKKGVLTEAQLRQRVLMAAKNRGRAR